MKQLTLNEVKTVMGSGAGGVKSPDAPTRGDENQPTPTVATNQRLYLSNLTKVNIVLTN